MEEAQRFWASLTHTDKFPQFIYATRCFVLNPLFQTHWQQVLRISLALSHQIDI